jgi:hypothetical protein
MEERPVLAMLQPSTGSCLGYMRQSRDFRSAPRAIWQLLVVSIATMVCVGALIIGSPGPPKASTAYAQARPAVLGYRAIDGRLLVTDLGTGVTSEAPPPAPDVPDFAISADLSTYAWLPQLRPWMAQDDDPRLEPWRLHVQRSGQPPGNVRTGPYPHDVTLSSSGALIAISPLFVTVDGGFFNTMVLRFDGGSIVSTDCELFYGRFSRDDRLLIGTHRVGAGAGSGFVPDVCAATSDQADVARAKTLAEAIRRPPHDGPLPTARVDDQAIVVSVEGGVGILTAEGVTLVYRCPTTCPRNVRSSPVLAPDGTLIAFEQNEEGGNGAAHWRDFRSNDRTDHPSIWVVAPDGTGLRRIGDGTDPFFVPWPSIADRHIGPNGSPRAINAIDS